VALFAIAFGSFLRLADLPSLLLFGDSYHGLPLSRQAYGVILSSFDANGSGIALPFLQRLCFDLFGASQEVYRLPAVAAGLAGLAAMHPVARRLAGRPAIATLAFAANPLHVFYSHFSRSYSIATFGCLVLVYALRRVSAEPAADPSASGRGRWNLLIVVSAALIPWVHLSALGVVASAGVGAAYLMWREGRSRSELFRLVASFGAAALICLALYLPAWKPFWVFYRLMTAAANPFCFGALDVAAQMFGSPVSAIACLVGVPAASIWMLRARCVPALLLVPAALAPIALLLVQHPYGTQIAYAHYLLTAIPLMLMPMSWAIVRAARSLSARPGSSRRRHS
jgi:uncharacterized membrane protein